MPSYLLLLAGAGALILLIAWLPMVLREWPLSLPIVCVGIGFAGFSLAGGDPPDPRGHPELTARLTELIILVALTGAGLKLDRPLGWRRWALTWRLLGVGMPLSIVAITGLGVALLNLPIGAALLLGAALAPTDPVLASDVQVGPPRSGEEDEVRFTLTAEAGLNDGLAFPFVHLAIGLILAGGGGDWTWHWLGVDLVWKLAAGVGFGWLIGRALGWLLFHIPDRGGLAETGDGFVALGATFVAYGLTELVGGYGFVAVFVAALAIRAAERAHEYHDRLHDFVDQAERLLLMVLLVLFGGAIAGGLLAPLGWAGAAVAALCVLVVRPAAGMLALLGAAQPRRERAAIAFFGIRGASSFYYLAYAAVAVPLPAAAELWAVLGATVLLSIVLHGVTATPAMRGLDRRRRISVRSAPAPPAA
jgi:sodium/hydrogen antiporter